jgi:dihydroorotase
VSSFGRAFYSREVKASEGEVILRKLEYEGTVVPGIWQKGAASVVPFWAGKKLTWEIDQR